MTVKLQLKEGAPPVEELQIRIAMSRTYTPNLKHYQGYPEDGIEAATNVLEALLYDKFAVDDGDATMTEMLDAEAESDKVTQTWDLVDADGNVWSEWVEEDQ